MAVVYAATGSGELAVPTCPNSSPNSLWMVRAHLAGVMEPHGVTLQQYNVLRILRGAQPEPLPTLEIGERLIERTPGVTRLLDRLEAKGWVRRERWDVDRRLVHCWITPSGLELLGAMDAEVDRADEAALEALDLEETQALVGLLERVRRALGSHASDPA